MDYWLWVLVVKKNQNLRTRERFFSGEREEPANSRNIYANQAIILVGLTIHVCIRIFGLKQFLNYGDSSGEVTALIALVSVVRYSITFA